MLEAGRAFAMTIFVCREFFSDVWTGSEKDWGKFIVIGVGDRADDHDHRREA
jgi:hypothetical protein